MWHHHVLHDGTGFEQATTAEPGMARTVTIVGAQPEEPVRLRKFVAYQRRSAPGPRSSGSGCDRPWTVRCTWGSRSWGGSRSNEPAGGGTSATSRWAAANRPSR
ncbi:MAG: hypothetical protein M5U19_23010 [Microthrixaceae bacterium]|nr:hypothetical protein [Microthrixaceae bacterium]